MTPAIPIACTLTPSEMPERLDEIASLGADALTSARVEGDQAILRFQASASTGERLAAIVAAEAECCAFLIMRLDEGGDALVLTINGQHGSEPVLRDLVGMFGATMEMTA